MFALRSINLKNLKVNFISRFFYTMISLVFGLPSK